MIKADVVVIGAGAAGLMCSLESAKRGRKTFLLDHSDRIGRKIIISGGGRCNFTNQDATPANYLSQNPHFCKSALKRYTQWDFLDLVQKHEIAYHEKKLGQLFCDRSSKDILNMLLKECDEAGVELKNSTKINSINKTETGFELDTTLGEILCESLVIATGGLSVPGTGASGYGYKIAEQFSLNIIPTRAALVPFMWNDKDKAIFEQLSGISLPCSVSCNEGYFEEDFLFTHKGLSGPAMLQISSYWKDGDQVKVDILPNLQTGFLSQEKKNSPGKKLEHFIQPHFPKRVFEVFKKYWLKEQRPLGQIPDAEIQKLEDQFKSWKVSPADTEGYRTAEVTVGGVDTNELSSKTMESKKIPGLYFIGEVVDVTGWLGGYNFQWAWSSGWSCGQFC